MGTLPDGHISSKTTQLGCVQQVARGLRGGIAPQGDIAGPLAAAAAAAPSRGFVGGPSWGWPMGAHCCIGAMGSPTMARLEASEPWGWHTTSASVRQKLHANGGQACSARATPQQAGGSVHLPSTGASPLGWGQSTTGNSQSRGVP